MNNTTERKNYCVHMADSWNFEQAAEQNIVPFNTYDDYIEHGKKCLTDWFNKQNIETNISEDWVIDPVFNKTEVELHFQCSPQEHKKLNNSMGTIFAYRK